MCYFPDIDVWQHRQNSANLEISLKF
jgi:hypothetical protein